MKEEIIVCGDFRAKHTSKIKICPELIDILKNSKYSICNFEGPVESNGRPSPKSGPSLDQDKKAPDYLMRHGFNVFLLGNNHIMDYGEEGCRDTIKAMGDSVIIGAGSSSDAYKVKTIYVSGKKIGMLSLVQHEFGTVDSKSNINNSYGAAWVNSLDVVDIIRESKCKLDYLMVFPHAGVEHIDAPLPEWRLLYKKMIDWGADIIIASHPHVPQGWEKYKNKYIFYSLGNFYFDELNGSTQWYNSLMVKIKVGDELIIDTLNLLFDKEGNINIDNSIDTNNHINYLNELLANDTLYNNYIDKACSGLYGGVKYCMLRGVGGFSFHLKIKYMIRLLIYMLLNNSNEMHLLNAFQNESHRWLAERYLRNNNQLV